jgi:hypothetical protein
MFSHKNLKSWAIMKINEAIPNFKDKKDKKYILG